jgi:hypothetical protein
MWVAQVTTVRLLPCYQQVLIDVGSLAQGLLVLRSPALG